MPRPPACNPLSSTRKLSIYKFIGLLSPNLSYDQNETSTSIGWILNGGGPNKYLSEGLVNYLGISMKMTPAGRLIAILWLKLAAPNSTRTLYAANYGGTVSRLSLEEKGGVYSFSLLAETNGCGYNPAWMELDKSRNVLLCLNEAYVSLEYSYIQTPPMRKSNDSNSCDRPCKMPDLLQR